MPQSDQCVLCKHYRADLTCDAFPDGVPQAILNGSHDHREPYKGDSGIRFEPVDDEAARMMDEMGGGDDDQQ